MRKLLSLALATIVFTVAAQKSGYKIAYNVYDSVQKDYEIYITEMDGSHPRNISNRKAVDWVYEAYADKIFFISDRDTCSRCFFLYQMDANGHDVKQVSSLVLEDSWQSTRNNGTEMIVSGRPGKNIRSQLCLVDLTTGNWRQVTHDTAAYHNDPQFLPNGKEVVFRYKKNRRNRNEKAELWKLNLETGATQQLTWYPASDTTAEWHSYHAGPPRYQPKDNFISYQSLQQSDYHLYAVTPDGKKHWKLTDTKMNEGFHSWSGDGKWLAFDGFDRAQSEYHIYVMNWDTKEIMQITNKWKTELSPVFVEVRDKINIIK
ncbi:MAG: DPP IV N-terminal domain-containing protein [Bacteroidota bacterium]